MSHPLEDIINNSPGFVVIGNSANDRFPSYSYAAYVHANKKFYCLDLGGLTESRGQHTGGKVYTDAADIPDDRGDLAILWVLPGNAKDAVDIAHGLGCTRVWFSFKTGHRDAVAHARELGMEVVEIGRCPVYYLEDKPASCAAHTLVTKVSGSYSKPPQLDSDAKRREIW